MIAGLTVSHHTLQQQFKAIPSVVNSRQRPRVLAPLKTRGKPETEGTIGMGNPRYREPIFKVDIIYSCAALSPLSTGYKRAAKMRMRENTHLVYLIVHLRGLTG